MSSKREYLSLPGPEVTGQFLAESMARTYPETVANYQQLFQDLVGQEAEDFEPLSGELIYSPRFARPTSRGHSFFGTYTDAAFSTVAATAAGLLTRANINLEDRELFMNNAISPLNKVLGIIYRSCQDEPDPAVEERFESKKNKRMVLLKYQTPEGEQEERIVNIDNQSVRVTWLPKTLKEMGELPDTVNLPAGSIMLSKYSGTGIKGRVLVELRFNSFYIRGGGLTFGDWSQDNLFKKLTGRELVLLSVGWLSDYRKNQMAVRDYLGIDIT